MVSNSINIGSPCVMANQGKQEIAVAIARIAGLVLKKDYETDISNMSDAEIAKRDTEFLTAGVNKTEKGNEDTKGKQVSAKAKGKGKLVFLILLIGMIAAAGGYAYFFLIR